MRYTFIILLLQILVATSCKKAEESTPISGVWKLVKVTNRIDQTEISSIPTTGTVFRLNVDGYKFSGNTFRNNFSLGNFTITNGNEIRFGTYVRSEVIEEPWGNAFFETLNSCFVQSLTPCSPIYFELKQDSMIWARNITPYELRFVRIN